MSYWILEINPYDRPCNVVFDILITLICVKLSNPCGTLCTEHSTFCLCQNNLHKDVFFSVSELISMNSNINELNYEILRCTLRTTVYYSLFRVRRLFICPVFTLFGSILTAEQKLLTRLLFTI